MLWMPPSAQRVLKNYYQQVQQPQFYDDVEDAEEAGPLYRHFGPSQPLSYPQVFIRVFNLLGGTYRSNCYLATGRRF